LTSIKNIQTAQAPFRHNQLDIIQFMQHFYNFDAVELRKVNWLYRQSGIKYRYSVLPDFTQGEEALLFREKSHEVGIEQRLEVYNQAACEMSLNLLQGYAKEDLQSVTHLITVSCTGITAPGLELRILEHLQIEASQRAINFMGCYAAIHAMKQSQEICALHKDAKVLVVDIELCTLHFQYSTQPDLVNSAMIFGDGGVSWMVENDTANELEIVGSYNKVLHNDKDKMAWFPSATGFLMQLSSYIPQVIGDNIKSLITDAISHYKIKDFSKVTWCVHPGGLKILDKIVAAMELEKDNLISSYEILSEYGNMSSPTVMYVLQRLQEKNRIPKGNQVLMLAFGPGLSIETTLLQA